MVLGETMITIPILSSLIGLNIIGAASVLMWRSKAYLIGVVISLFSFVLSWDLFNNFDTSTVAFQFQEQYQWLPLLHSSIHFGVDGIAVAMIILTTFTTLLVLIMTRYLVSTKLPLYTSMFLLLQAAMVGVFSSLDGVLFYIFWETTLIPMVVCIGVWGSGKRCFAATKFFIYTFLGSTLLLLSIIYLGWQANSYAFSDWALLKLSSTTQLMLFWGCLMAFAIKIPMWPVHTWLPDAHTEAPTAGSVLLAALLLKVGAFGLLRFNFALLPEACLLMAWPMIVLSLIAIVGVGLIAFAQTDMKRLIAYSSVAHMGFVTLGFFSVFVIFPQAGLNVSVLAFEGALLQMIAHAFSSGAMFLAFGMLYHQAHTREIGNFGGLATVMPYFSAFFILFCFSNIGVPGTAGFVGEFTVIIAMASGNLAVAACAALSLIIGATYTLWMVRRVFFGPVQTVVVKSLKDIGIVERSVLSVLVAVIICYGVYPSPIFKLIHPTAKSLVQLVSV